jgi:hypothetical protein
MAVHDIDPVTVSNLSLYDHQDFAGNVLLQKKHFLTEHLHSLAVGHQQATFADIEPEYDTLVFFPSWSPHEVLPVHVPSGRFMDSRFDINCWIHRALQDDSKRCLRPRPGPRSGSSLP